MIRIGLYLGFPPKGGGAFQYALSVLNAASHLPSDEYEIIVAYTEPAWSETLVGYREKICAVAMHEGAFDNAIRTALRLGFPLGIWRAVAAHIHPLTKNLLRQRCDAWIFPAQDVWTYATPTKAIGVIHDLMHRHESSFPEVSNWGLFRRRERHYKNLCARVSAVLVDSQLGKQQACDAYQVDPRLVHILPFVAPDYIQQTRAPADFDSRYSLPEKFLFYPAQFWAHKNHVRLLQALAIVRDIVPDLHLVLAGSSKNAYANVLKTIARLKLADRVHVLGYVPDQDMPVFYGRARALVMPTFFGPTNIPPLEAMASGCPMAISNIYAMPQQVGDAALFFNPTSVKEIAEAITRLATDDALCRRLSAEGREQSAKWGQSQFNKRFLEIIQKVFAST